MGPKISIIVPVYNVEAYLHRCIDSIINQTYKNLEVILINDGSDDNSGEICDYYSKMDTRVKVIHQKNMGLSGARNSGLKIVTGSYIGFVDSDDWVELEMFETMLFIFEEHDVDVVECSIFATKKVDNTLDRTGSLILETRMQSLKRIIKNQSFSVWRRLYPSRLLDNITFVEGKNSEDVYFTINIYKMVNKTIYLTNNFYNYFVREESITKGKYKLKVLDSVDAALYLKNKILNDENDKELNKIARNFLLDVLLYNYKMLHYNSNLDTNLKNRNEIKKLIGVNYDRNNNAPTYMCLARFLPIQVFNLIIRLYAVFRNN